MASASKEKWAKNSHLSDQSVTIDAAHTGAALTVNALSGLKGYTIWSVDDGLDASGKASFADLATKHSSAKSQLGVDVSIVNGKIVYDVAHWSGLENLGQGQHVTDTFTYCVRDSSGNLYWRTEREEIWGHNHDPHSEGCKSVSVDEGSVITGHVGGWDSDYGAKLTCSSDQIAGLTMDKNGDWRFDAGNAAYDHLAEGATQKIVVRYNISDECGGRDHDGSTITIIIHGKNDGPVDDGPFTTSVSEDDSISGAVTGHDVDDGAVLTFSAEEATGLTFNSDGTYSFDATGESFQHLAVGDHEDVVVHYTVTDEHGAHSTNTLTITVNGVNDDPTFDAGPYTDAVDEDSIAGGSVTASDVDDHNTLTFTTDDIAAGFTLDTDGSYELDASLLYYQHLNAGVTEDVVVHIHVEDENGGYDDTTLTITVTGVNDDATIEGTDTGDVTEDNGDTKNVVVDPITASGQLTVADVDDGEDHFQEPSTLTGDYGSFVFDTETGEWTYTLDNTSDAVQALQQGDTVYDTLHVISADGTAEHDITVTIHGTQDDATLILPGGAPPGSSIEGFNAGPANEDGDPIGGQLLLNDPDHDQALFQDPAGSTPPADTGLTNPPWDQIQGTYGFFVFNVDTGEWSYQIDNTLEAVQNLQDGAIVHDVLPVTSADGSLSVDINITITGQNDIPEFAGITSFGVPLFVPPAAASLAGLSFGESEGHNSFGFGEGGYDSHGYGRDGYNSQGYDRQGYGRDGYNSQGYDRSGYDSEGYNHAGYDRSGHDHLGNTRHDYNEEGYDSHGYNHDGYDRDGKDRNGHTEADYGENGRDENGYDHWGYDEEGYDHEGHDHDGNDHEHHHEENPPVVISASVTVADIDSVPHTESIFVSVSADDGTGTPTGALGTTDGDYGGIDNLGGQAAGMWHFTGIGTDTIGWTFTLDQALNVSGTEVDVLYDLITYDGTVQTLEAHIIIA